VICNVHHYFGSYLMIAVTFSLFYLTACKGGDQLPNGTELARDDPHQQTLNSIAAEPDKNRVQIACAVSVEAEVRYKTLVIRVCLHNKGDDTLSFLPSFLNLSLFPSKTDFFWYSTSTLDFELFVDTAAVDYFSKGWAEPWMRFRHVKNLKVAFIGVLPDKRVAVEYMVELGKHLPTWQTELLHSAPRLFIALQAGLPIWSSSSSEAWKMISEKIPPFGSNPTDTTILVHGYKSWVLKSPLIPSRELSISEYEALDSSRAVNTLATFTFSEVKRRY